MRSFKPVTRESHGAKAWRRPRNFSFAAQEALVPLTSFEASRAAAVMPIGFIEQAGRYILVGLLSPVPGKNLCVGPSGEWLGQYIPASLRAYPFSLVSIEGTNQVTLVFDEASGLLTEPDETTVNFYDPEGNPTPESKQVVQFLREFENGRIASNLAAAGLAEAGVIHPWPLSIKDGKKQVRTEGLFRIDEVKLNALDDASFLKLRSSGALTLAYMQLFSLMNVQIFEQLSRFQQRLAPRTISQLPENLDDIFNPTRDDTLQFD